MANIFDTSVDGHVHTSLCNHAVGSMEDYVQAAISKGLRGIVFLEHLEVGVDYFERTWLTDADFEKYWQMGRSLQEKYKGSLDISLGVEVGYNPQRITEIKDFLSRYQWDRVGVSYHFFATAKGHVNMLSRQQVNLDDFTALGVERVLGEYLVGLLDAVEQIPATVLCHLDAALRHHPDIFFSKEHNRQIKRIVEAMAQCNIALEINTSGLEHKRKTLYPARWIIDLAVQHGVELLPGSDAHKPSDVGRHFDMLATSS